MGIKSNDKNDKRLKISVLVLTLCVLLAGAGIAASLKFLPSKEAVPVSADVKQETKTITVGSGGDIIIHSPFYRAKEYRTDGDYDFSACFSYVKRIYEKPSFMAVNLETTLPGKDAGYSGYPMFKSPDSLADSLVSNGADLMLLANNHIYDSGVNGFLRTSEILEEKKILYTGARHSEEEKKYMIKDIDGIKVGFINYTYETPRSDEKKGINGNPMDSSVAPYLNSFDPNDRETFYAEISQLLASMKLDGAEYIISYLHWGNEYKLKESSWQREIAQRLCDMGVDAIIGGHPHVVQPVDVFTSSDGNHKMFCAFSLGNQLSNQRREMMNLSTGHTEDGLVVNLEITKKEDGEVSLTGAEYIPTWVYKNSAGPTYYIIPLDNLDTVEADTGISGLKSKGQASYDRTYDIIGSGIQKVKDSYGF
ncbi:MAG: CapA family protein [Anaerovoracaceae bacterium]